MIKTLRAACLAAMTSAGLLCLAPAAQSATTVLDFAGNICGAGGNSACSDGSAIGQNYGDGTGVNVGYRSALSSTGVTYEAFLKHWNLNYGDLAHVVWGGPGPSGYYSEISFTALPGYELSLIGFDAGCYLNRASCQSFPYSVTLLGGGAVAAGSVLPPSGGHDSVILNTAYSASGYVLRWGPDGYDGGLDNIAFDVRAVAPAVPEPASWVMMILGLGAVGGALRRRHPVSIGLRV